MMFIVPFLTPRFFFLHPAATTEIYTLSLHDALPIFPLDEKTLGLCIADVSGKGMPAALLMSNLQRGWHAFRSEEHTSELQSHSDLVCRLLLEKKKKPVVQPGLTAPFPLPTRRHARGH